jgi:hypothetical protein
LVVVAGVVALAGVVAAACLRCFFDFFAAVLVLFESVVLFAEVLDLPALLFTSDLAEGVVAWALAAGLLVSVAVWANAGAAKPMAAAESRAILRAFME